MKHLVLSLATLILTGCGLGSSGPYHQKDGMWFFENEHMRVPSGEKVVALNNRFARTTTLAFYRSSIIEGVDPATFLALTEHYARDKSHVWYADTYRKGQEYFSIVHTRIVQLSDADPASFHSLDTPHAENDLGYAKDKGHVWFDGQRMIVGDVASFEPRSYGYARDRTTGYYMRLPVPGSDGPTFTNVGNEWAKDRAHVWWSGVDLGSEPSGAIINRVAEGADPVSFEALDGGYGKDRARVWFHGAPVEGADPRSFVVGNGSDPGDARDKSGAYDHGQRVTPLHVRPIP
jgi:hypothetical protein